MGSIVEVPGVSGRGKVERAVGGDHVDRLRYVVVLEDRLCEIADVVDDYVGARVTECDDVRGEGCLASEGGGEEQRGPGCDVVHDLEHC